MVKAVNFIRGRAVNYRLFKAFCDDFGKKHQYLLFHSKVQSSSRGKVLSSVVELVTKVAVLLREHGSVELATLFDDNRFELKVFYLADIFSLLNELSYSLQGKNKSQIKAAEKVSAFKKRLSLWKKRVSVAFLIGIFGFYLNLNLLLKIEATCSIDRIIKFVCNLIARKRLASTKIL